MLLASVLAGCGGRSTATAGALEVTYASAAARPTVEAACGLRSAEPLSPTDVLYPGATPAQQRCAMGRPGVAHIGVAG